jgi:hypothetical protein
LVFDFNFDLEYLKRVQSSEPLHTKILYLYPPTSSEDGLYGHKPKSFQPNWSQKMRESQQLFSGLRIVSRVFEKFQHLAIKTKILQHLSGIFHQIKANLKKGFCTSHLPHNEEIGSIFVFSKINPNKKIKTCSS